MLFAVCCLLVLFLLCVVPVVGVVDMFVLLFGVCCWLLAVWCLLFVVVCCVCVLCVVHCVLCDVYCLLFIVWCLLMCLLLLGTLYPEGTDGAEREAGPYLGSLSGFPPVSQATHNSPGRIT